MINLFAVTAPQAWRADFRKALDELGCEIEAQGWADGSTSWRFIVVYFSKHLTDSDMFSRKLRDAMSGYSGWLEVRSVRDDD